MRVVDDPRLQIAQGLALGELDGQLGTELRLPAGALEEHYQVACYGKGQRAPHIVFDECQWQIDRSGHSGRSPKSHRRARRSGPAPPLCPGAPAFAA